MVMMSPASATTKPAPAGGMTSLPTVAPPSAREQLEAVSSAGRAHRLELGGRVTREPIQRDEHRHTELLHVADVALEVRATPLHRSGVSRPQLILLHTAVH